MTFIQKIRAFNVDEIDTWMRNEYNATIKLFFERVSNKGILIIFSQMDYGIYGFINKKFVCGSPLDLVVNAEDSQSVHDSQYLVRILASRKNNKNNKDSKLQQKKN